MTDDRHTRRRQTAIGRRLRQMYVDVLHEDLPEEFITLLCEAGLQLELKRLREMARLNQRLRRRGLSPDEPMMADAPPRPGPKRPLLSTAAQLEWDGPLANPDTQRQPGPHAMRALRLRQDGIGRQLRQMYANVVTEDLPDDFIKLLCEAGLQIELKEQRAPMAAEAPDENAGADAPAAPRLPE
jgi:anti-sigma factor NepR-like protein